MRRARNGERDADDVIVEFVVDEADAENSGREVTDGLSRPVIWGTVATLVVALIAATLISRHGDTPPAAVATTTTVPPAATITTTPSATKPPPVTVDGAIVGESVRTSMPFGRPTGQVLYLTPVDGGAPTSITAYDVDSAEFHTVDLGRDIGWYNRAIALGDQVFVDGGEVIVVWANPTITVARGGDHGSADAPVGRIAAGPAATIWVRTFDDPPGIMQVDQIGIPVGPFHALPEGGDLFGSLADGRPVVRAADGRAFVVEADSSRTLLANNALAPVDHGRFAEVRCDEQQVCDVIGHVDGAEVSLGPPMVDGARRTFRFQPDGPYVAIAADRTLVLHHTGTGVDIPLATRLGSEGFGSDESLSAVRFLPGDTGLAVVTSTGVVLFDLEGVVVARLGAPVDRSYTPMVLGVGEARPWTR